MKPTGIALTAVAGNGSLAVVWNILCPQLGMFEPAAQAVLHTALAALATGAIALAVRLIGRLSRRAEMELSSTPAPTGTRVWWLELLAGLHARD